MRTKTRTRSLSSSLPPAPRPAVLAPVAGEAGGRGESTRDVAGDDSVLVEVRGVETTTCEGASGGFRDESRLESVRCPSSFFPLTGDAVRPMDFLRFTGDGERADAWPGDPVALGAWPGDPVALGMGAQTTRGARSAESGRKRSGAFQEICSLFDDAQANFCGR